MFESGITVKNLIDGLRSEIDIALPISDSTYIDWLNSLEQLLYSEFIREQNSVTAAETSGSVFNEVEPHVPPYFIDIVYLSQAIDTESMFEPMRFEDIYTVFADDIQLIKTTYTSGKIFPNTWYKPKIINDTVLSYQNALCVNAKDWDNLLIVYFIRPKLKTVANKATDTVKLPLEFIDLAKTKLRGEAYKLANEDEMAAKWLNDYNVLLESFKVWSESKRSMFGE